MSTLTIYVCCALAAAMSALNAVLAVRARGKASDAGHYLAIVSLLAAGVGISYALSALNTEYFAVSLWSGVYFLLIDWMLVALLDFSRRYNRLGTKARVHLMVCRAISAVETVIYLVNPFFEIAVGFARRSEGPGGYYYVMKPLYYFHLAFTYAMVVLILVQFLLRLRQIPREYRGIHTSIVAGIVFVVLINAGFLFLPQGSLLRNFDFSIFFYSLVLLITYWAVFHYSSHGMMDRLRAVIFADMGQGVVLFDFQDEMILCNDGAKRLLPQAQVRDGMPLAEFLAQTRIEIHSNQAGDAYSLQCYSDEEGTHPLRCDYHVLKNGDGVVMGKLFVFTDAVMELDLLTGFESLDGFRRLMCEKPDSMGSPSVLAVCDINGLSSINLLYGREEGDRRIRALADLLREQFPADTFFLRGQEAYLFAVCYGISADRAKELLRLVAERFDGNLQYATSGVRNANLTESVRSATKAMQSRKLLDRNAAHSQVITSLVQALQETDSGTEAHVQRTRAMGARLGARLGFTDEQQSDLALLCLLHDIGKIGIPLEILNKTGGLTDEEWVIMRSHAEKGCQIVKSIRELSKIAEMVLHHHECWDGSGYPSGLKGESIPLLSRIIAVVDAYDAMVSDRVYRKGMPPEAAKQELLRCAGTQFDPSIVREFIAMVDSAPDAPEMNGGRLAAAVPETPAEQPAAPAEAPAVKSLRYTCFTADAEYRILSTDAEFEALTGYSAAAVQEQQLTLPDLIPEADRAEYCAALSRVCAIGERGFLEYRLRRADGGSIPVSCRIAVRNAPAGGQTLELLLSENSGGRSLRLLAKAKNEDAHSRLLRWEDSCRTDSLTGLLNFAAFRGEAERRQQQGGRMLLLMLDVEHLKAYNIACGHSAGDELLILIAQTLQEAMRPGDLACRMGGDEFAAAIVFDRDAPAETVSLRACQVYEHVSMVLAAAGHSVELSAGAAYALAAETSFDGLARRADSALLQAKRAGGGTLAGAPAPENPYTARQA